MARSPKRKSRRDGKSGKQRKGHQRSRDGGAPRLEDDIFNPNGIFAQILRTDNGKKCLEEVRRIREQAAEEKRREAAVREAAAQEAEQQRQRQPKMMTLDEWKREQLYKEGATRKEASLLVRCYKTAQQLGGWKLTLDRGLLRDVAARRRRWAAKNTSGQASRGSIREAEVSRVGSTGKRTAQNLNENTDHTDQNMDLGFPSTDLDWDAPVDEDSEGGAVPGTTEMTTMYIMQMRTAGLLHSSGISDGLLLPPGMIHEHDGDAAPTITTFAVPHFDFNASTGKGVLRTGKWFQVGFAVLANGQNLHFCDCNEQGACALRVANVERAQANCEAEKVQEGDCIHIDLLKALVPKAEDHEEVAESCTQVQKSEEEDTCCFELGTFTLGKEDYVVHQVGYADSYSGLAAGIIINDKCVSGRCTSSNGFCVHRTTWCREQNGPDWTNNIGDVDGADARESEEVQGAFYASTEGHMSKEVQDQLIGRMLNENKDALKIRGVSKSMLPFPLTTPTSIDSVLDNFEKLEDGRYILRDSPADTTPYRESSLLFHEGGFKVVQVFGENFDGGEYGILNINNKYLFTHGLIQGCLDSQDCMSTTFKAYWRSKVMTYKRFARGIGDTGIAGWSSQDLLNILSNRRLGDLFTDAAFDFITRLQIDYEVGFKCACPPGTYDEDDERMTWIYDNACNFLRAITLRMPVLADRVACVVDTLHYSGHNRCSYFFNKRCSPALNDINSAVAEQKNRFINFMKTSVAFMCQPRAMVFLRYHLYVLNQTQREIAAVARRLGVKLPKVYVSDGVGVGVKKSQSLFYRPFQQPNRQPGGKEPERDLTHLAKGAATGKTVMIPAEGMRDMLHDLLSSSFRSSFRSRTNLNKSCLSSQKSDKLLAWIHANCKELEPYIKVQKDTARPGMVVLTDDLELIQHCLQHWSSTASEIKLVAPPIIDVVQHLCETRKIPSGCNSLLVQHSPGVAKLLEYDAKMHPQSASKGLISENLCHLLARSLGLSRAALKGETDCITTPFEQPEMTSFELMVRSGTFTSEDHLVVRELPGFFVDYNLEKHRKRGASASGSASSESRKREKNESKMNEVHERAVKLGACTKFKTSHRALTPGIFTSYCGGCYICEFFELMDHAECALTPFRIVAHRAWCPRDVKMHSHWRQTGEWQDPLSSDFGKLAM